MLFEFLYGTYKTSVPFKNISAITEVEHLGGENTGAPLCKIFVNSESFYSSESYHDVCNRLEAALDQE